MSTERSSPPQATRAAFVSTASMVMLAMAVSRLLGLVRESLLGSAFSAGAEMDAFRAASRVTQTLYVLVAGGALGSAFIPTFAGYLAHNKRDTAWQMASAVVNLVFLVSVMASGVAFIISPWLVSAVIAPGYTIETQALTVSLLRWMVASTAIFGVSGLLMGILNAHDHFLTPAFAPSLYNLGIILGAWLFARWWGIHGVAVGTVVGAMLHLCVQLPSLRKLNWIYSPTLGLRLDGVREVGRLMGPRVLGLAITELHFWININLGSRIGVDGVVSALTWGWQLMLLPQGIFAQAIATVAFPSFSAQVARKQQDQLRTAIASVLGMILLMTLPATVGLIVLRRPLVEMLLMRGEFDPSAVAMVTWALAWYAVGLVAHSGLEIITRAFYALHDTATPVWIGGGAMALNIVFSVLLSQLFVAVGQRYFADVYLAWMPLGGLALANSVATTLETLTLAHLLRRRLGGLDGRRLWASAWRDLIGATVMAAVLVGFVNVSSVLSAWSVGLGGIVLGAGTFVLCLLALGSPELALIWAAVRRRLVR